MTLSRRALAAPLLLALILSGCAVQPPAPVEQVPAPTPPVTAPLPQRPPPGSLEYPDALLTTPKVRDYQWIDALHPLINDLIQQAAGLPPGTLLINSLSNRTNGNLSTDQASDALYSALADNQKFTLITRDQVATAREQLGLSADDKLTSRSKALAIARRADAQYALYTTASGDVNAPHLQMQLLQVLTGEILWSSRDEIQP